MIKTAELLKKQAQELQDLINKPYQPPTKFESLKPRDFEQYLEYVFMADEPENVGSKDTFEDNFANWLETKDVNDILDLVAKYERKTF
jgi:hypothetical protein